MDAIHRDPEAEGISTMFLIFSFPDDADPRRWWWANAAVICPPGGGSASTMGRGAHGAPTGQPAGVSRSITGRGRRTPFAASHRLIRSDDDTCSADSAIRDRDGRRGSRCQFDPHPMPGHQACRAGVLPSPSTHCRRCAAPSRAEDGRTVSGSCEAGRGETANSPATRSTTRRCGAPLGRQIRANRRRHKMLIEAKSPIVIAGAGVLYAEARPSGRPSPSCSNPGHTTKTARAPSPEGPRSWHGARADVVIPARPDFARIGCDLSRSAVSERQTSRTPIIPAGRRSSTRPNDARDLHKANATRSRSSRRQV